MPIFLSIIIVPEANNNNYNNNNNNNNNVSFENFLNYPKVVMVVSIIFSFVIPFIITIISEFYKN